MATDQSTTTAAPAKVCRSCKIEKPLTEFYRRHSRCKRCANASTSDWYKNHPEKRREAKRRWEAKNPDKVKAQRARAYIKNQSDEHKRKRHIRHCLKWQGAHRELVLAAFRKYHQRRRLEALAHYSGGLMRCACCGESTVEFLAIDHINNDGAEHRRRMTGANHSGNRIFVWLKKNGYPPGFQVLCHNCNMAKGFYGVCPHQKSASIASG